MAGKSPVQVFVRTRPTSQFGDSVLEIDTEKGVIHAHARKTRTIGVNNTPGDWVFRIDKILNNVSQETVYDTCARDLVHRVLDGYHASLLTYGQTGAGKTFTITGGTNSYKYRGVAPRAISHIFQEVRARPEFEIVVRVSYLEIYNEVLYDLLADNTAHGSPTHAVMDDANGNLFVKGLKKVLVENEEDALSLLFQGDTNRAVGEHVLSKESSRSHAIFTVHLEARSRVESAEKVIRSKLNLVDLAGSERVKKTDSRGNILREAQYINRSLSFLEQVVIALSSKSREHIPFRSSKLTNVLRDSLGGNCFTRLIANIWPEERHFEETVSTLKFATRMMRLSTCAHVNVELDPDLLLEKYAQEIRDLKQELAMHDALANRGSVSYDPYTPEQQYDLAQTVRRFVRDEIESIEVVNLRHVYETFRQFKLIIKSLEEDRKKGSVDHNSTARAHVATIPSNVTSKEVDAGISNADAAISDPKYVGELDESQGGFSVGGTAPTDARPASSVWLQSDPPTTSVSSPVAGTTNTEATQSKFHVESADVNVHGIGTLSSSIGASQGPRAALQLRYQLGPGKALFMDFSNNKEAASLKKKEVQQLARTVNDTKRDIDARSEELRDKRASFHDGSIENTELSEVIDEEEYQLIRTLKNLKKTYQEVFSKWKVATEEFEVAKKIQQRSKLQYAHEFLVWMNEHGKDLEEDALDDGETFEKMETERIMKDDPASLSYYNARKKAHRTNRGKKGSRFGQSTRMQA